MVGTNEINVANSFARIAVSDSTSASTLYTKKAYPQACYLLQQSVEKSSKGYGLLIGTVKLEELVKPVGHLSNLSLALHIGDYLNQNRQNLYNFLEKYKKAPKPKGWVAQRFDKMLPALEKASELLQKVDANSFLQINREETLSREKQMWEASINLDKREELIEVAMKQLQDKTREPSIIGPLISILNRTGSKDEDQRRITYFLHMYRVSWRIGPLGFLTMWHEEATRYPKVLPTDFGSYEDYDQTTPFVKEFTFLKKHALTCGKELLSSTKLAMKGTPIDYNDLFG